MKNKPYAVFLTVFLFVLGQTAYAQLEKGVTSTGKEVDCSTINPSVDKTVSEYGKIVTHPRVTRNGEIITDDCAEDILVNVIGADSKQFCSGGNVNVEYTASHPGITGTGISYKWYVNDVLQTETGASFTATFSADGNYVVRCDVSQGTANGSGYKMTSVEAFPLPTVVVAGADQLCEGINTTLTATSGFTSYVWSSNVVSSTTNTAIVNAGGTYTVTVTDANGCQNTASKAVTGHTLPVVAITGDSQVCGSESVTLTATSDLTTYVWSSNVASSTNNTATVNAGGTYTVTVTDSHGCKNTVSKDIAQATVTGDVTISGTNSICSGSGTTLTVSGVAAGDGSQLSYKWYKGTSSTAISGATSSTYSPTNITANTTYRCVVTPVLSAATSCAGPAKESSYAVTVTTPKTGTLSVSANPATIWTGSGTSSTLTASVSGTTAGTLTYQWYSGSSAISGATATTYTVTPTSTTTYKCIETATLNGCTANNEKSVKVTVNQPTLTVTSIPNSASIGLCSASSIEITYTADYSGPTPTSYSWSVTGGPISGASNTSSVTVIVSSPGTVSATCTVNYSGGNKNASKSTTVTSGGQPANMVLYEDYNARSIQITSTNCITSTLVWKNSSNEVVLTGFDQIPSYLGATLPNGIYTVTGSNSDGCSVTKSAVLGVTNTSSCYASALKTNEVGSGHTLTAVKDHENNQYAVFTIAGYCMTQQNMRCSSGPTTHSDFNEGVHSAYNKSYVYKEGTEGYLYNWHAALDLPAETSCSTSDSYTNRRGICPDGWHIPSWDEWYNITHTGHNAGQFALPNSQSPYDWWEVCKDMAEKGSYQGDNNVPGCPLDDDKNATGFSAVPAGFFDEGRGVLRGGNAYFWSSTSGSSTDAKVADLARDQGVFYELWYAKTVGYSVRCIRDY